MIKTLKNSLSEGKIAYLIKPILTVLQDSGGKLDRTEIKNRISELDEQIAEFAEAVKTSKSIGNTYKEFNFKFNFAIKKLSFLDYVTYSKGNSTITLTEKGLNVGVESLDVDKEITMNVSIQNKLIYTNNSYLKGYFKFHNTYKSMQIDVNLTKNVVNLW